MSNQPVTDESLTNAPGEGPLEALARYASRLPRGASSSQLAYDALLGAILTRILPPGYRLPEIPVAQAIKVGRTPTREALMRLESDGFVTSEPRVGLVVASDTLESIAEIYEVREVLESFATRLAARYARPVDILALRRIIEESVTATETLDTSRLRALNTHFHESIHVVARNGQLRRTLRHLINRLRLSPISAYSQPGRAEAALAEHRAIVDAIAAHDEEHAAHLAAEHQRRDREARMGRLAEAALSSLQAPDDAKSFRT